MMQREVTRTKVSLFSWPNMEAVFELQLALHQLTLLWSSAQTCCTRRKEWVRISLASCPLMAHPISGTWALNWTCAQETWRYCSYTTETGYVLFSNLGSLPCPQSPCTIIRATKEGYTERVSFNLFWTSHWWAALLTIKTDLWLKVVWQM